MIRTNALQKAKDIATLIADNTACEITSRLRPTSGLWVAWGAKEEFIGSEEHPHWTFYPVVRIVSFRRYYEGEPSIDVTFENPKGYGHIAKEVKKVVASAIG